MILPIRIGLIGTGKSATREQLWSVRQGLYKLAEMEDDNGCKKFFITIVHDDNPGSVQECLQFCEGLYDELEAFPSNLRQANIVSDKRHPPIKARDRHDILVQSVQRLMAVVKEPGFTQRSETWRTIWNALERHCPVAVIYPDGEVRLYN